MVDSKGWEFERFAQVTGEQGNDQWQFGAVQPHAREHHNGYYPFLRLSRSAAKTWRPLGDSNPCCWDENPES